VARISSFTEIVNRVNIRPCKAFCLIRLVIIFLTRRLDLNDYIQSTYAPLYERTDNKFIMEQQC
jgi:hypothetical protein